MKKFRLAMMTTAGGVPWGCEIWGDEAYARRRAVDATLDMVGVRWFMALVLIDHNEKVIATYRVGETKIEVTDAKTS